jgi:hypothetical protein
MPREVATYTGRYWKAGRQCRAIVTASSKKLAAELLSIPMNEFRNYWSKTGNKLQLEVAQENKVFYTDCNHPEEVDDYIELRHTTTHYNEKQLEKLNIVTLLLEADAVRSDVSFHNAAEGPSWRNEAGARSRAKSYWSQVKAELDRTNVAPREGNFLL